MKMKPLPAYFLERRLSERLPSPEPTPEPVVVESEPAEEEEDREQALKEAYENGFKAAVLAQKKDVERQAKAAQEKIEQIKQEMQAAHDAQIGDVLTGAVAEGLARLESEIDQRLFAILVDLLPDLAAKRASEEIAGMVRRSLEGEADHAIRISGPESIRRVLEARRGGASPQFELVESESEDVTVRIDRAIIESRAGEWRERVRELTIGSQNV